MSDYRINDLQQYLELWKAVHMSPDKNGWNHFLPYYDDNIYFKDTVQEIRGIKKFSEMVERLSRRSKNLEVRVYNSNMEGNVIFVEWEMIMSYKKYPKSSIFGLSRITLSNGKIIEQRDYYDLWGDIFDNIWFLKKGYRRLMKWWFG